MLSVLIWNWTPWYVTVPLLDFLQTASLMWESCRELMRLRKIIHVLSGLLWSFIGIWHCYTLPYQRELFKSGPMKIWLEPLPVQMCWQIEVQRQKLRWMTMSWNKRFKIDRRKSIFTLRTTRCWVGLFRDPLVALFSEVFKTQLDKALSTQAWSHSLARSLN